MEAPAHCKKLAELSLEDDDGPNMCERCDPQLVQRISNSLLETLIRASGSRSGDTELLDRLFSELEVSLLTQQGVDQKPPSISSSLSSSLRSLFNSEDAELVCEAYELIALSIEARMSAFLTKKTSFLGKVQKAESSEPLSDSTYVSPMQSIVSLAPLYEHRRSLLYQQRSSNLASVFNVQVASVFGSKENAKESVRSRREELQQYRLGDRQSLAQVRGIAPAVQAGKRRCNRGQCGKNQRTEIGFSRLRPRTFIVGKWRS